MPHSYLGWDLGGLKSFVAYGGHLPHAVLLCRGGTIALQKILIVITGTSSNFIIHFVGIFPRWHMVGPCHVLFFFVEAEPLHCKKF